jgi:TonB-dependent SusC/RagA subfamily outer membrane receptor
MRLASFGKIVMSISSPIRSFALAIAATAFSACAAERAVAPQAPASSVASAVSPGMGEVPLLFVVDGVRLRRDQVPSLSGDQIASVSVLKGSAALREYGPDASYGVVVITTKAAAMPRS